jgi:putative membrane protein
MKFPRIIMGAAVLCAVVSAASATAQDRYGRDRYNRYSDNYSGAVSTSDFVQKAAQGSMAEVALSNLARRRAADQDVRDFASRMVQDHSQANRQLHRLAWEKGLSVPTDMDFPHRIALTNLRNRSGEAFDRAYMRRMVDDHQSTLAMFRTYARNGADPDLRAWARQMLPALEHHRSMARETEDAVSAGYGYDRRWRRD